MVEVVPSTTLRNNLSDILEAVENKKPDWLLVTGKGKTRAALVNLDLFEDLLACSIPQYIKSIKDARKQISKGEYFTHKEAFGELE